jgi:hypothetical protein
MIKSALAATAIKIFEGKYFSILIPSTFIIRYTLFVNKQWYYFFLFIGILTIFIAILLWSAWGKTPENPETSTQIVQESSSYEVEPRKSHLFKIFEPLRVVTRPFEELITSPSPLLVKEGKSKFSPPLEGGVRGGIDPLPASDPTFKKLYPDYYLEALRVTHLLMVNDGFLPQTSLNIPDEDALFAFLSATIDYAETKNFITQADAERFRTTLHGKTRELLRQERYSFLNKILQYLGVSNAFAGIITADCYADPFPFNLIPGVNLPFDYCCNCGLICTGIGPPVFVPDCSIKKCDVPLGCLNLVCPTGNAIWDPVTGICGCDNPVSAAINIPSILKNALNCIAPKQPAPPTLPPPPPPPPPSTP